MPLRNRVTPLSELVADPARGLVYGNRGCLHDEHGRVRRLQGTRRWISCQLEFRGWRRGPLLQPGRFTELFFLDEATAFAAGHRPCALCRRADYAMLQRLWRESHGAPVDADTMDARLHEERLTGGAGGRASAVPAGRRWNELWAAGAAHGRRVHDAAVDGLPDGAFVLGDGDAPWLVLDGALLRWTPSGYAERAVRPAGERTRLLTPPSLLGLLHAAAADGWRGLVPLLHPSAFE